VADIGREGVGWYLPGDGVALGRRIGCRVRSRSIGVAAVLGPGGSPTSRVSPRIAYLPLTHMPT